MPEPRRFELVSTVRANELDHAPLPWTWRGCAIRHQPANCRPHPPPSNPLASPKPTPEFGRRNHSLFRRGSAWPESAAGRRMRRPALVGKVLRLWIAPEPSNRRGRDHDQEEQQHRDVDQKRALGPKVLHEELRTAVAQPTLIHDGTNQRRRAS